MQDISDTLSEQIIDVLNASELNQKEQVMALVWSLASLLATIKCRECRQLTRKTIEGVLSLALDEVMQRPASIDQHHLHAAAVQAIRIEE
jgi:hypothetical protein